MSWEDKLREASKKYRKEHSGFTSKITTSSATVARKKPTLHVYEQHVSYSMPPPTIKHKELKPIRLDKKENEPIDLTNKPTIRTHRRISTTKSSNIFSNRLNKNQQSIGKAESRITTEAKAKRKLNIIRERASKLKQEATNILMPASSIYNKERIQREINKLPDEPYFKKEQNKWQTTIKRSIQDEKGNKYNIINNIVYSKDNRQIGKIKENTIQITAPEYANNQFKLIQEEERKPINVFETSKKKSFIEKFQEDVGAKYKRMFNKSLSKKKVLTTFKQGKIKDIGKIALVSSGSLGDVASTELHAKAEEFSLNKNPVVSKIAAPVTEFGSRMSNILKLPYSITSGFIKPKSAELSSIEKSLTTQQLKSKIRPKEFEKVATGLEIMQILYGASSLAKGLTKAQEIKQLNLDRIKSTNKVLDDLGVPGITDKEAKLFYKLDKQGLKLTNNINNQISKSVKSGGYGESIYTKKLISTTKPREGLINIENKIIKPGKTGFVDKYLSQQTDDVLTILKKPKTISVLSKNKGYTKINLGNNQYALIKTKPGLQVTEIYKGDTLVNFDVKDFQPSKFNIWRSKLSKPTTFQQFLDGNEKVLQTNIQNKYFEGSSFGKKFRTLKGYQLQQSSSLTSGKRLDYTKNLLGKTEKLDIQKLKFDLLKGQNPKDIIKLEGGKIKGLGREYNILQKQAVNTRFYLSPEKSLESKLASKLKTIGHKITSPFKPKYKYGLDEFLSDVLTLKGQQGGLFVRPAFKFKFSEKALAKPINRLGKFSAGGISFKGLNMLPSAVNIGSKTRGLLSLGLGTSALLRNKLRTKLNNLNREEIKLKTENLFSLKPTTQVSVKQQSKTKQLPKSTSYTKSTTSTSTTLTTTKPINININYSKGGYVKSIWKPSGIIGGFKMPNMFNGKTQGFNKQVKKKTSKYNKFLRDMWKSLTKKSKL